MLPPRRIALVSSVPGLIPGGLLSHVAAAVTAQSLQVQQTWGAFNVPSAIVAAFGSLGDAHDYDAYVKLVPSANGSGGFHLPKGTDGVPVPFAIVQCDPRTSAWATMVSHEVVEMLIDPAGTVMRPGPSPDPDTGPVEYLVEACDPCQQTRYALPGFPDVPLSDFCLPGYYGWPGLSGSVRGSVTDAFSVAPGGVLTFRMGNGVWCQITDNGIVTLDHVDPQHVLATGETWRGLVDRSDPHYGGPVIRRALAAARRRNRSQRSVPRSSKASAVQAISLTLGIPEP